MMLNRKNSRFIVLTTITAFFLGSCAKENNTHLQSTEIRPSCAVFLNVLGVAQDAGKPQIANPNDPAWQDHTLRQLPTSIALIDQREDEPKRWLIEATPHVTEQLQRLDELIPANRKIGLDGIFLTHAHIGHYAGMMFFGHEAAGAEDIPVYTMPRMATYLAENGPWSQLVRHNNIILAIMANGQAESLSNNITITPFLVPHRQEFSEVVGFRITGPEKSALFIPDIDSWEEFDTAGTRIEDLIASVDVAYLDATFFANGEIPYRDMSGFPHPFVSHSMARFEDLPVEEKSKIRFIHMNHTNPLLREDSDERAIVNRSGFEIADEGEIQCL